MSASMTAHLDLLYMAENQAGAEILFNQAQNAFDTFGNRVVIIDTTLTTPPTSPNDGDVYVPAASSTGVWSTKDGLLAMAYGGAWAFFTPWQGLSAYIESCTAGSNERVWNGTAWAAPANPALLVIANITLTTPPGSPTDLATYQVATGGSGAWSGKDGDIAYWSCGAWIFYAPFEGLLATILSNSGGSEFRIWSGSAWVATSSL
jgi:hypothetical protein